MSNQSQKCDNGLVCSYISRMIGRSVKLHTIGEQLILPAIEQALCTVVHHLFPPSGIIRTITFSNNLGKN